MHKVLLLLTYCHPFWWILISCYFEQSFQKSMILKISQNWKTFEIHPKRIQHFNKSFFSLCIFLHWKNFHCSILRWFLKLHIFTKKVKISQISPDLTVVKCFNISLKLFDPALNDININTSFLIFENQPLSP